MSRRRLQSFREAGIKFVQVLGCNCEEDECDAYRAVKGRVFEIQDAPQLPLAGCDQKYCKCILLARGGK